MNSMRNISVDNLYSSKYMGILSTTGRRTQVAKGEVCKTFIQRFESARRLI